MSRFAKRTDAELIKQRRDELRNSCIMNKIEYKEHGDYYSYINYGKPDIKTIICNELQNQKEKIEIHLKIKERLDKINISYKDHVENIIKLINTNKKQNIEQIIKEVEMMDFFNKNQFYNKIKNKYDQETAKIISLNKYINENKNIKKNDIDRCMFGKYTISFE